MILTLENEALSVQINTIGAELHSIVPKKNNIEMLWQGDPAIWSGRAPVLFPIVGGLKEGVYTYNGQSFALPRHGFIRHNAQLEVTTHTDTQLSLLLISSEETLLVYPFHFVFEITFELVGSQIVISHKITNIGDNTLFFAVGAHPAFNCPITPEERYEDYYIQLDNANATDCYVLTADGLISTDTIDVIEGDRIPLSTTLFDNDALIFKNIQARKATLMHRTKGALLSLDFSDFPDLGIWAKPNAPYVCIEPWLGYADVTTTNQRLEDKEGIQQLPSQQTHLSSYSITIA